MVAGVVKGAFHLTGGMLFYLLMFVAPFLGPFLRGQPFKGIGALVGGAVFIVLIAMYPMLIVLYAAWGLRECHNMWNYKRGKIVLDDYN